MLQVALCLPNKRSNDASPYCCDGINDCVQYPSLKLGDSCPISGQPAQTESECISSCCKAKGTFFDDKCSEGLSQAGDAFRKVLGAMQSARCENNNGTACDEDIVKARGDLSNLRSAVTSATADCVGRKKACAAGLQGVQSKLNQTDAIMESGEQACNMSWINSHCTMDIIDTNAALSDANTSFSTALTQCSTPPSGCAVSLTTSQALLAKFAAKMEAARCRHNGEPTKSEDCRQDLSDAHAALGKTITDLTAALGPCASRSCEGGINTTILELTASAQAIEAGVEKDCNSPLVSLHCFSDYVDANGGLTRATGAFNKAMKQCTAITRAPVGVPGKHPCRHANCACTDPSCTSPCPAGFVCFGDAKCCPNVPRL